MIVRPLDKVPVSLSCNDLCAMQERALQDRLRDLDEQLTSAKVESAKARREKEECERRFNSKLYDLKVGYHSFRQYSQGCMLSVVSMVTTSM